MIDDNNYLQLHEYDDDNKNEYFLRHSQSGKTWTFRGFLAWAKLGLPIAGNFYQAQWDPQVDILWRTFDTFYE